MHPSNYASIRDSILNFKKSIHITGPTPSARAFLIAQLAQNAFERSYPILVLCNTDDTASEFCSDLECMARSFKAPSLENSKQLPLQISHFPTWAQSPYSSISLSLKTRLARLQVLQTLQSPPLNPTVSVIVTSIAAACQATLPRSLFKQFTLALELGTEIESRESFLQNLKECGYLQVDPVEDPGTFAVRGDIIDVFPTASAFPFRTEFFGNTVDRIRRFDPATQVTVQQAPIQKVIFPPAREVLINSLTVARTKENLKLLADAKGIPRVTRDPILSSIFEGSYPDHSDAWAPFAYASPETLWDYLLPIQVIWNDELSCREEWGKFASEQKTRSQEATQSGAIVPEVEDLYPFKEALDQRIQSHTKLYLDGIEWLNKEQLAIEQTTQEGEFPHKNAAHTLEVLRNTEFSRGSRESLHALEAQLRRWVKNQYRILILATTQSQIERIRFLLEERKLPCQTDESVPASMISLKTGSLSEGFQWPAEKLAVFTESEFFGSQKLKKEQKKLESGTSSAAEAWSGLQTLSDLSIGDFAVHSEHGIGRYQGLIRLELSGAPSDFLLLEYANQDKLYIPAYRLNTVQKFSGGNTEVVIDRLGSQQFSKTKEKVKESVKELAINLVQLYAERKLQSGIQFSPRDAEFREFESQFQFEETPDQLKAINDVLADMEAGRLMDRLVCGDVGYGKTEVAIRAAFKAVSNGKQVAVLVPTTVLAQQHEQSFKARLKDYPLIIESVSRFKSFNTQKEILRALSEGKIDIIIGTHRLLSKDVRFNDLGLVIVDEEHRFGVEHKERLKTLKINAHVLTLTATPIPRTLHMALSGLKDISLINTPPIDRLPIRTYVAKYDETLIKRAIEYELSRGGQVFFLHNRVQTIKKMAETLQRLVPQSHILIAHGQMPETQMEETMAAFFNNQANILVCTTIIESGLDLPSANTIVINRADSFGLAQLYQIRGRVGRSHLRAYAYLLVPSEEIITDDARRRLEVIQKFVELGSGFSIASHDLDIRGGGDLLGAQQSGSIQAVGFDLYTELLEEAIRDIQGKPNPTDTSRREPEIKTYFAAFLSEIYIPNVHQRLSLYRRFSAASQEEQILRLEEELNDRFGPPPLEAQNLIWIIRVKLLLKQVGIDALTVGPEKISLLPGPETTIDTIHAIALISANPQQYQITPDSRLIATIKIQSLHELYFELEKLIQKFSKASVRPGTH